MNKSIHHVPNRPDTPKSRKFRVLKLALSLCLLVFVTVAVIIQWVVFPKVPQYTQQLQQTLLNDYQIQLDVDSIETGWSGFRPSLTIHKLRVAQPKTAAAFTVPSIQATIAWRSLWQLSPVFHNLTIHDPALNVTRISERHFLVSGVLFDLEQLAKTKEPSEPVGVLSWLSRQKHLQINNGHFVYLDQTHPENKPLNMLDANMRWHANLNNWTLNLNTKLLSEHIQTPLQLQGSFNKKLFSDADDLNNWSGQFSSALDELDFGFFAKRLGLGQYLASAKGAIALQAKFKHSDITASTAEINFRDVKLSIQPGTEPMDLELLRGTLSLVNDGDRWIFTTSKTRIKPKDMPERELGNGQLELTWFEQHAQNGSLRIDFLDLPTLHSISKRLPLPKSVNNIINHADPQGTVHEIEFHWQGDLLAPSAYSGQVAFNHISLHDGALTLENGLVLPGIKNLSGQVGFNARGGQLQLHGKNAAVSFPGIFVQKDLPFDEISVVGSWKTEPVLRLNFDSIKLSNPSTSLAMKGVWSNENGPAGMLDLTGDIHYLKASDVHRYIPIIAGGVGTNRWLEGAFYNGLLTQGKVKVHGALHRFPFHQSQNGEVFRVTAKLEDVQLDYVPSSQRGQNGRFKRGPWPLIDHINGDIVFDGLSMSATVPEAKTLGAQLKNVSVRIPNYTDAGCPLIIDGSAHSDLSNMGEFVNRSPVSHWLGDFLQGAVLSKPASLDLHLMVPITDAANTLVDGRLTLAGNDVSIVNVPPMQNAHTLLHFTQKGVTADPITATVYETPVQASIRTQDNGAIHIATSVEASADMAAKIINVPVVTELLKFAQGKTQADVSVEVHHGIHIRVNSDLKGIAFNAPAPFNKKADKAEDLNFAMSICSSKDKGCQSQFDLKIGQLLNMTLDYQKQGNRSIPTYGAIGILQAATLPEHKGLVLLADLPKINLSDWKPVFSALEQGISQDKRIDYSSIVLNRMHIKSKGLNAEGLDLGTIDVQTRLVNANRWDGSISADAVKGTFSYLLRHHDGRPFVSAHLSHLYLSLPQTLKTRLSDAPSQQEQLPGIDITVNDLRYEKYALGRVRLHALNEGVGKNFTWRIKELSAQVPEANLNIYGAWTAGFKDKAKTYLSATLDVNDLGKLLDRALLPAVVKDGKGQVQATLNWTGAPNDFNLSHLNGTIASTLASGQLLQIEPGAARILSLISLQTLQRRLMFDFRDVIGTGFVFDSIISSADIHNGIVKTKAFNLVSPQATVLMSGEVNLPAQRQDLTVTVLPSISFAGPTLALSLANPIVGVGSFLAQLALQAPLSKLFSIEYQISGTFDNPTINKNQKASTGTAQAVP